MCSTCALPIAFGFSHPCCARRRTLLLGLSVHDPTKRPSGALVHAIQAVRLCIHVVWGRTDFLKAKRAILMWTTEELVTLPRRLLEVKLDHVRTTSTILKVVNKLTPRQWEKILNSVLEFCKSKKWLQMNLALLQVILGRIWTMTTISRRICSIWSIAHARYVIRNPQFWSVVSLFIIFRCELAALEEHSLQLQDNLVNTSNTCKSGYHLWKRYNLAFKAAYLFGVLPLSLAPKAP